MQNLIKQIINEEKLNIRNSYRPKYFLKENVMRQEIMIEMINEAFADFDRMTQAGKFSNQQAEVTVADVIPKIEEIYSHTIIFFDTETTGLMPKFNQLSEIGALCVVPEKGERNKVVDQFNMLIQLTPYMKSRIKSEELSTLTDEALRQVLAKVNKSPDEAQMLRKQLAPLTDMTEKRKIVTRFLSDRMSDEEIKVETDAAKERGEESQYEFGKTTSEILTMTNYFTNLEKVSSADEKRVIVEFKKFIESMKAKYGRPILMIAHNAPFDMKFINTRAEKVKVGSLPRVKVLDSLKFIYDYYYPMMITVGGIEEEPTNEPLMSVLKSGQVSQTKYGTPKLSFRLGNLSTKFNISAENWHTAIADVEMLMKVMDSMVTEIMNLDSETDLRTGIEQSQGVKPDYSKKKDPQAAKTRKDLAAARAMASPDIGVLDKPGRGYATGYELEPDRYKTGPVTPESEKTRKKKAAKAKKAAKGSKSKKSDDENVPQSGSLRG